jgi:hypothetical protein
MTDENKRAVIARRALRINALTPEQANAALHYLSGYTPEGIDLCLARHNVPGHALCGAFDAMREADPDGAADAVFALIEGDALAKIRARILEEDAEAAPLHCGAVCGHDCTCSLLEGHPGDHKVLGVDDRDLGCSWPQDAAPDTAQHSCEVCRVPVTGGEIGPDGVTWLCDDHRAAPDTAQRCALCGHTGTGVRRAATRADGSEVSFCDDRPKCAERRDAQPEDIPEPTSLADALKASLAAAQPEDSPVPSPCRWCGTTEGDLVTFASTDDGSESRFCKDVDACYTRKPSPGGRTCPDCGAVGLPVRDAESHCYNTARCAERQAAKAGAVNG